MTCNTPADVFDLGIFAICGDTELPIELPSVGEYILNFYNQNTYIDIIITTEDSNEKPVINLSYLPVNTELMLRVINPDGAILSFDMDIPVDPCSEDEIITKCFTNFKIKTIFKHQF